MNDFLRTPEFDEWLKALRDAVGKARILARLRAAALGNFGDCEPVGEAVFEMRIHVGPGYRVHYTRRGPSLYLLLCGGDKSTQQKDVRKAKEIAALLKD